MRIIEGARRRTTGLLGQTRGAVSIIFATAILPLVMSVGLAVDYSFYVQAESQLNLAADAGAIHAVRLASSHFVNGDTVATSLSDGARSAQQWFVAQAGLLPSGSVSVPPTATQTCPTNAPTACVTYNAATSTFTSTVSYTGTVTTHFAGVFNIARWPIGGTASAVITTNSYVEIQMLIDNSSSMLIGATPTDIIKIEKLTLCTPTATAIAANQPLTGTYSWYFGNDSNNATYGYGAYINYSLGKPFLQTPPPPAPPSTGNGACDGNFTGGANQCPYPAFSPQLDSAGYCPTGYGIPDTTVLTYNNITVGPHTDPTRGGAIANIPQAPCGFACHTSASGDYWSIVKAAQLTDSSLQLRYDVVQAAAAQVVTTMETKEQVANQFSLGVYTFNSAVTPVYPAGSPVVEAGTNLPAGLAAVQAIQTPIVPDVQNTNFPGAMSYLSATLTPAGDGTNANSRRKNMFIITDGLEDYNNSSGTRVIGQMTSPINETVCAPLKARGFTIYVLYTPYFPLPNEFYLYNGARISVEAPITDTTNSIAAALQACATTPQDYYQASSSADINTALQSMLNSALNSPGRISQ